MASARFQQLLKLCKRRGFLFQSAEIYGGLRGAYDYGPLGIELKKNIQQSWWKEHVYARDDVVGIDTSIVTPHPVLKASGHVDEFSDLLVDCMLTKDRFRPDKAPALHLDAHDSGSKVITISAPDKAAAKQWHATITQQLARGIKAQVQGKHILLFVREMTAPAGSTRGSIEFCMVSSEAEALVIPYDGYVEPGSHSPFLTASRPFNLMFKTFLDPIDPIERVVSTTLDHRAESPSAIRNKVDAVLQPSTVYLRPETAQGVFINYEQVARTMNRKPPFGIAQCGKSFRNEIRLEHAIFRTPEFEQMELEYFVQPWTANHWYKYWSARRFAWWRRFARQPDDFRQRAHEADEMAHYATGCIDVEYLYPWGWGEVEGVAHRGDYDLVQHMKNSRANFTAIENAIPPANDAMVDPALAPTKAPVKYVPHTIESSCGLNRAMLAFLCDAYHEIPADPATNQQARPVLQLHPQLAPVKCAVMPLTNKPEFASLVAKVARSIRKHGWNTVIEAQNLKIGKRYYRHDEIGTPWCITVDYTSIEDDTVTIRQRDSGEQHRVHWKDVAPYINDQLLDDMDE
ncbi:glycyl-tRNA synthetase [Gongronella butleri]|nr:glycyl-tRNA synthetase [Gongronella butleri]